MTYFESDFIVGQIWEVRDADAVGDAPKRVRVDAVSKLEGVVVSPVEEFASPQAIDPELLGTFYAKAEEAPEPEIIGRAAAINAAFAEWSS